MKKRILASLMALCLIVGLLPATALAAEEPSEVSAESTVVEPVEPSEVPDEPEEPAEEPGVPMEELTPAKPVAEELEADVAVLADAVTSGDCGAEGSNVKWELTQNNSDSSNPTYTLTISGTGAMADFPDAGQAPWYLYFSDKGAQTAITEIIIGKDVTIIGANAFVWCKAVKNVSFEAGSALKEIHVNGFHSLVQLTSIDLPASLVEIGGAAFYGCTALQTVSFQNPDRLTALGESAFGSCKALVRFNSDVDGKCDIPQNVTSIGGMAFQYCISLTDVTIPAGLEALGSTFYNCSKLTSVTFAPGSVVKHLSGSSSSDVGVFARTALTSIDLPDSVETIGRSCFQGSKLTAISIPARVQSIGINAFAGCPLTSVTFAEDSELKEIGTKAFASATVNEFIIPEGVELVGNSILHNGKVTSLIRVPSTLTGGFSLGWVSTSGNCILDTSRTVHRIAPYETNNYKLIYVPYADQKSNYPSQKTFAVTNGGFAVGSENGTLMDVERKGYIFDGWYQDANFQTPAGKNEAGDYLYQTNRTYYAKWIKLEHEGITLKYGSTSSDFPAIDGVALTDWTSANPDVVKIENSQLIATGVGTTTITANAAPAAARSGETLTVSVTVTAKEIKVSMTDENETYNEQPHTIEAKAAEGGTLPADLELVYSYKESTADDSPYIPVAPTHPGTYTVKVESGNPNYTLTGKTTATLTISEPQQEQDVSGQVTVAAPSLTYDGKAKVYSAAYDGIDNWTIVYYNAEGEKLASAPVNAGDYWVTINGENKDKTVYASITESFTIGKATVTIRPNDKSAYVGDAVPVLGKDDYTVTGFVGDDTLSIKPTLAYESTPDMSQTGTYAIKASGAVVGPNYEISYKDGTLTVSRRSSGGGSSSGSSGGTTTETEKNPDGPTTTTVIDKKTGTVTETTKSKDGSTLVVETQKDGTVTTTETAKNGVKIKTVDEPGEDVTAKITVPKSVGEAVVTIPADVDYGMVAVDARTGEVVKLSVPSRDGMTVKLDGSAELVLVDRSRDFTDTKGHWAEDAIDFATAHELFAGTSDTTFTPDSSMTRAMLMTVLARFDGQDTTGGAVWYDKAMAWAKENGISDGSNPNGNITREQFATMLWRYAGSPAGDGTLSSFGDSASVNGYAVDAMRWAVSTGIISGMSDGTLAPQSSATRAQVATMLMRFVENLTK